MDYTVINMLLSGAGVLLIREVAAWYIGRRVANREDAKQAADVSIPINEQAVRVYKDIIESLRTDMHKLVDNTHYLDDLLLKCREEKVELKTAKEMAARELELVKVQVVELKAEMAALTTRIAVQETKTA